MTLCVLKHGGHWDFMALKFGVKGPTFERLIVGFVLGVSELIYKSEVTGAESESRMAQLIENDQLFRVSEALDTQRTSPFRWPSDSAEIYKRVRNISAVDINSTDIK